MTTRKVAPMSEASKLKILGRMEQSDEKEFVYLLFYAKNEAGVRAALKQAPLFERLREALEPFAEWADFKPTAYGDELYVYHAGKNKTLKFKHSDCVKAKAVLAQAAEEARKD